MKFISKFSPIVLTVTLASLLVPSLGVPVLAITHQWERLKTDNVGNIWFFDKNIQKSGAYRAYWQRYRYNHAWQDGVQIEDTYYSIECKTKLRRQRQEIDSTSDGKVIRSNTNAADNSEVVPPNTPDMLIANYVCKQ